MGDLVIQSRDEVRQFRPARDQRDAMRLEETATGFEGRIALRAQAAVFEPLAHGHIHRLELAQEGRPDEVVASVIPPTAGIAPAAREQSDPLIVSKRVDAEPAPRCEGTDSHRETPSVKAVYELECAPGQAAFRRYGETAPFGPEGCTPAALLAARGNLRWPCIRRHRDDEPVCAGAPCRPIWRGSEVVLPQTPPGRCLSPR